MQPCFGLRGPAIYPSTWRANRRCRHSNTTVAATGFSPWKLLRRTRAPSGPEHPPTESSNSPAPRPNTLTVPTRRCHPERTGPRTQFSSGVVSRRICGCRSAVDISAGSSPGTQKVSAEPVTFTYTNLMIPLPKPRGFWDYGLFALIFAGLLVLVFWAEGRSRGIGLADVALALAAAGLCVFAIILLRRNENAAWIAQPTWRARLLLLLGVWFFVVAVISVDAYLLHHTAVTGGQIVPVLIAAAAVFVPLRRRKSRQLH